MGIIISSAVVPMTLTLLWSKQNWMAATISPIFGFVAALITWFATTYGLYGEITVDTTNENLPMMAGNLVALFSPAITCVGLTLIKPDNFTFDATRNIQQVRDETTAETSAQGSRNTEEDEVTEEEKREMDKSSKFAKISSVILAFSLFILWPIPMFASRYVFSLPFFRGWVVVSIIWVFLSTFAVGIFPLWEARKNAVIMAKAIWADLTGKRRILDLDLPTTASDAMITEKSSVIIEDKKESS